MRVVVVAQHHAALAFANTTDAAVVLSALRSDPTITAAALYDGDGSVFAVYPEGLDRQRLPVAPRAAGYEFDGLRLMPFQPVEEKSRRLGTLYVEADTSGIFARARLYALSVLLVAAFSSLAAYLLSRRLEQQLMRPIQALKDTAQAELYLHVVDISHPAWEEQRDIADMTVRSIENPGVETMYVFNKIDRVSPDILEGLRQRFPDAAFISAVDGIGIETLRERIESFFYGKNVRVEVVLPAGDGKNIAMVRELLPDARNHYEDDLCVLNGTIESGNMGRLEAIPGAQVRYLM